MMTRCPVRAGATWRAHGARSVAVCLLLLLLWCHLCPGREGPCPGALRTPLSPAPTVLLRLGPAAPGSLRRWSGADPWWQATCRATGVATGPSRLRAGPCLGRGRQGSPRCPRAAWVRLEGAQALEACGEGCRWFLGQVLTFLRLHA